MKGFLLKKKTLPSYPTTKGGGWNPRKFSTLKNDRHSAHRGWNITTGLRLQTQTAPYRSLPLICQLRYQSNPKKTEDTHAYAATLNLPTTQLPIRPQPVSMDKMILHNKQLYEWNQKQTTRPLFVLHDGPPYANGTIHCGHALNKILKDMINRYKLINGYRISYIPGWDTHGLPIENKALEEWRESTKKNKTGGPTPKPLEAMALRKKAAAVADREILSQKKGFQSFNVLGEWEQPYTTKDHTLEAEQLKIFKKFFTDGTVHRGLRPVYWSPKSRTALAESEIEYNDNHMSKSIYVGFEIKEYSQTLKEKMPQGVKNLKALIWTTTPWTILANQALAVNPTLTYCIAQTPSEEVYLIGKDLVETVSKEINQPLTLMPVELTGADLVGSKFIHPLFPSRESLLIPADYVTTESGTGVVHSAPGHGHDDFDTCKKHGIEKVINALDDDGCFTAEFGEAFEGKSVLGDANDVVIDHLKQSGKFVHLKNYQHKYPYDWRSKTPLVIRSTEQWFINLTHIRENAVQYLDDVRVVPAAGKNRLTSFIRGRAEWCISRQRSWGVPIPVLYNNHTGEAHMTEALIDHFISLVQNHGTDSWFELPVEALIPESEKRANPELINYVKGTDTLDVWLDSGVTWNGVLASKNLFPADVYLEGSDQHRGWFQTSLITAASVKKQSPFKTLITHGFVLDEEGKKMSKSLGNIVDPLDIINGGKDKKKNPPFGINVLRMWVAHSDYTNDVLIGNFILTKVMDFTKKVRNTLRFCLANLDEKQVKLVDYNQLREVDRLMLHLLYEFYAEARASFEDFHFFKVYRSLVNFCNIDLSPFYFDIIKDRIYSEKSDSVDRRSAQTVLYHIHLILNQFIAPLIPNIAEEIYEHSPAKNPTLWSIFQEEWKAPPEEWKQSDLAEKWKQIRLLRNEVNKKLEVARVDKLLSKPNEATIKLDVPDKLKEVLLSLGNDRFESPLINEIFQSAHVEFTSLEHSENNKTEMGDQIFVQVEKSPHERCGRCWRCVAASPNVPDLCLRCDDVLNF